MPARVKALALVVASAGENHPLVSGIVSVGSMIVMLMQSAQEVVSTLIAFVASIATLVAGIMALRGTIKKMRE